MKMNITITKIGTGIFETDSKIADIDICNGNWKYNDDHMETDEKIPLTINTIRKSRYLSQPVKDAYPFYNHDAVKENNELIVTDAMVRIYESFLEYLNCRIENTKEEYCKFGWTERTYNIVLFDLASNKFRDDVTGDIVYEKEALLEVKFTVVE